MLCSEDHGRELCCCVSGWLEQRVQRMLRGPAEPCGVSPASPAAFGGRERAVGH